MEEVRLGTRTLQPRRQLLVGSRRLPLGRRALDVLSVLAEAGGEIVTKDELLAAVWPGIVVEENALQVHVVALRKALGAESDRLRTIRGVGYQLQLGDGEDGRGPDVGHAAPAGQPVRAEDQSRRASIVVLPFENLSADPEQDYFADGITEDIITDLSQVSALKVIARNSAFAFRGRHVDVATIARQLDVTHVLEGSVRKSESRMRVSARLIDAAANEQIWAARFDRDLADIFDVQDQLTEAIVGALRVRFLPAERKIVEARSTSSAEAYDHYIRARALRATMQPDNIRRSLEHHRKAVEIDPGLAKAWAGLASGLIQQLTLFSPGDREAEAEMEAALMRASELAPDTPDVVASRAQWCVFRLDWEGAERCIEFFAGQQDAGWSIFSHLLLTLGRAREAAEQQYRVWRSDPLSPGANWGLQFHLDCAGRLDEAEKEFEKSKDLPGAGFALEWEAAKRMMALGDRTRVLERFRAALALAGGRVPYGAELANALDRKEEALDIVRRELDDPLNQIQLRLDELAHWAVYLGDDTLALDALRRAMVGACGLLAMGIWHPNFAGLRRDRRFKDILRDLGLVDHWRKTGNWGEFARSAGPSDFEIVA